MKAVMKNNFFVEKAIEKYEKLTGKTLRRDYRITEIASEILGKKMIRRKESWEFLVKYSEN